SSAEIMRMSAGGRQPSGRRLVGTGMVSNFIAGLLGSNGAFWCGRPEVLVDTCSILNENAPFASGDTRLVSPKCRNWPPQERMDLELLRRFVAVAQTLNFRQAARQLGMSQPPLSRSLRQLE